jgi:hypothetical protein
LGFLLMLVFLAVGLAYGYYHKQRHLAVTRAQNELEAIANLKASQIVYWRQERQLRIPMISDTQSEIVGH